MFLKSSSKCHLLGMQNESFWLPCLPRWMSVMSDWLATKQRALQRACLSHCCEKVGPRGCGTEVVFHTMRVQAQGIPKPVRLNSIIQKFIKKKNLHLFTVCSVPHFISNFPFSPPKCCFYCALYLGTWATAICRPLRDGARIRTQVPGTTKLGFS